MIKINFYKHKFLSKSFLNPNFGTKNHRGAHSFCQGGSATLCPHLATGLYKCGCKTRFLPYPRPPCNPSLTIGRSPPFHPRGGSCRIVGSRRQLRHRKNSRSRRNAFSFSCFSLCDFSCSWTEKKKTGLKLDKPKR